MSQCGPGLDAVNALKCELASEVLRSFGALRLCVTGWSMLPTVWPGDTLQIERAGFEDISEGDIVLFGRDRRVFAHRVVAKVGEFGRAQIITQGDGMARPDPPVTSSELLGKIVLVVSKGRCIEPGSRLGFSERVLAALVRRSDSAARVVVGVHGLFSPRGADSGRRELWKS